MNKLTPEDILANSINHEAQERRSTGWNNEHHTAKKIELQQLIFGKKLQMFFSYSKKLKH